MMWSRAVAIGILAASAVTVQAQTSPVSVRGYAELDVALPHNEPDLGLCTREVSNPYPNTSCSSFARYVFSGYLELRPFGKSRLRHLFGIFEPQYDAGDNVPGYRYTASAAPILWESTVGAGYELPRNFELRYTHHVVNLLGRFNGAGAASLRPDGPYGKNSTIGVRWKFGQRQSVAHGYVDLEVAPPHYEVDLGLCTLVATNPPSPGCAAFARYVWEGYVETRPLRRISVFLGPKVFEGNNIPQLRYNGSAAVILWELQAGVAVALPRHVELRLTHHEVTSVARYGGADGAATLRSHGPYGPYTSLGVRWNFGSR